MKLTCSACGMQFGGETGFVDHRAGKHSGEHPKYGRHCLTVDEMAKKGYELRNGVLIKPMPAHIAAKLWRKDNQDVEGSTATAFPEGEVGGRVG